MARARKADGAGIVGVMRLDRAALLRGTALQSVFMLALMAAPAGAMAQLAVNARPQGGVVSAGAASIVNSPNTTAITQSSQNAAIDWSSFNVGSAQAVRITAPDSRSVTVNRVAAGNPSSIAGQITDNGVFVLTNPSGVVFAKGAQVTAASVLVTTLGIANQNLMAGQMVFDQPGKPGARVVNKGQITVRQAGLAALVAPGVANSGTVSAPMGRVALAGAQAAVVDLYGDGLMSVDVTKQVQTVPAGRDGKPVDALVTNTGVITATGGKVLLTASAVDGIVTDLVSAGGKITANTARDGLAGTIVVHGIGGSLSIEGDVSAAGKAPGTTGGAIELNASNAVNLAPAARVDASGKAGGGTVAIGTTLARAAGGPSVTGAPAAKTVTVAPGAIVSADATRKGNGGKVAVLSSEQTVMSGSIAAKGGALGGDGGTVEVSGASLRLTGHVDAAAPAGRIGTLLLDPLDLYVSDTEPSAATYTVGAGDLAVTAGAAPDAATVSWVSPALLQGQNADIALSATRNLFVASGNAPTDHNILNLGNHALALTAGTNLTIDRGFTVTASGIALTATSGAIILSGTSGVDAGINSSTSSTAMGPSSLQGNVAGANVTMAAGASITLNDAMLGSAAVPLGWLGVSTGSGGVTQAAGAISASMLVSSNGVAGSVSLPGPGNQIGTLGVTTSPFNAYGLSLGNAGPLTVAGLTVAGGGAVINANGALTVAGPVLSASGPVSLSAAGNLLVAGTASTPGHLTLAVTGQGSLVLGDGTANAGTLIAGTGNTISVTADTFLAGASPFGGVISAVAGVIEVAPATAGAALALGAPSSPGTLGFTPGAFAITARTLRLGSVQGTTVAGGIIIAGSAATDVSAIGTLDLQAAGAVTQAQPLIAGTLTGSALAFNGLGLNASIDAIGNFTAPSGLILSNNAALTVSGQVNVNQGRVNLSAGTHPLSVPGGITAASAVLTGGSIDIGGSIGVAGQVSLLAGGDLTAAGVLNAGTLAGNVAGSARLNGTNAIGTLGAFAAGPTLAIADTGALLVAGSVTATALASIAAPSLTVAGFIAAPATTLVASAGTLTISGGVSATGTVSLAAPAGALLVSGTVTDSAAAAVSTSGPLSVTGSIAPPAGTTATAVSLTGATISLVGTVSDGGGGTTALYAGNAGTIAGAGGLTAGTLSGTAAVASLLGQNTIAAIGLFTAGPTLALADNAPLLVNGSVTATTLVSIGAPTLGVSGLVAAPAVTLAASAGTLGLSGTVNAASAVALSGAGGIAGETGTIIGGGALTANGSGGSVALANAANAVASVAGTANAGFSLTDGISLNVGSVSAGTAAELSAPAITVSGRLSAARVALTADSGSLSVPGTITDSSSATLYAGGLLSIGGRILPPAGTTATALTLTGATIAVAGSVSDGGAGTTALFATQAGTITEAGALTIGTLSGSAGAARLTPGSGPGNQVATLGSFSAGKLALDDTAALTVAGPVAIGTSVAITDQAALSVTGTIAPLGGSVLAVTLNAGTIVVAASGLVSDGGFGTIALLAGNAGTVSYAGTLIAGTLSGSASVATLTGATATANQIASIDSFSAGSLTLNDGLGLAVAGALTIGTALAVADSASLLVSGTIAPPTGTSAIGISLTAGTITNATTGLISAGTAGTAGLFAVNAGTINGLGALVAGTLTGSAGVANLLASSNGGNQVGTLGSFTAGSLLLNDKTALAVTGPVRIASAVTLADTASILVSGSIAPVAGSTIAVGLTAATLSIAGTVSDGGAGSSALFATNAGTINETGALVAGTLTGSAAVATLAGANTIAALGSFAAGTTLAVTDAAPLVINGPVTAGTQAAVTAPALSVSGFVGAPNVTLTAASGTLTIGGTVSAAAAVALGGSLGIAGGAGTILGGGGLTASSAAGSVVLTNGSNAVASAAGSAGGAFSLTDRTSLNVGNVTAAAATITAPDLTVSGSLAAGNATLTATAGTLSVPGTVTAATGAIFMSSGALTVGGLIAPSGGTTATAISLTGSTGTIAGTLSDGGSGSVSLIAPNAGAVSGTGTLITGVLSGTADAFSLTGIANKIASLGTLTGTHGVSLADASALTVAGRVSSPVGTVALNTGTFGLAVPGAVTGLAATLSAGSIDISGLLGVSGVAALIANRGGISETGALSEGTLTGSAASVASLTGTNTIAALAAFTAPGGLTLSDGSALSLAGVIASDGGTVAINDGAAALTQHGTVIAGSLTLAAASIASDGTMLVGGTASLVSAGTIADAGVLNAATLTGSAGTGASFSGANSIVALADFAAPGGLVLNDAVNLAVSGPVASSGGTVVVNDGGFALGLPGVITAASATLAAGAITIGGTLAVTNAASLTSAGTITETGFLNAGTLAGSAATLARFTGTNTIGTLASISAGSLLVADAAPVLTVAGSLRVGTLVSITQAGSLLVSGSIGPAAGAIAVGLTAASVTLTGQVSDGGAGTTSLVATGGTISETGALTAGTLTGAATLNSGSFFGNASLTGANQIGTLGTFSAAAFQVNDSTGLTVTGPVVAQALTIASLGSVLVNGAIGSRGGIGDATLSAAAGLTVAPGALIWSLGGAADLEAGNGFTQSGGLVNARNVVVRAASGAVTQTGGTIAAVESASLTAVAGGLNEAGGIITANGAVTALGASGVMISAGTVIAGAALRLGTDGPLSMTGGEVVSGAMLTVGGDTATYSGGNVSQTGGTLAANGALFVRAGNNLSMTAGGTRYAGSLDVDSNGTSDANLNGGAVTIVPGSSLVYCGALCLRTIGGGFLTGGSIAPGPLPGQALAPGSLTGNVAISGAAIVIDQPEIAGTIDLIAHGSTVGAIAGTINETGAGSVIATALTGLALNHGSVALSLATNQLGTLAAFSADGDFRLTDQAGLRVLGPVAIGTGNTGSVNTGSIAAAGGLSLPAGSALIGGSGSTVANVVLDTGMSAGGGAIVIGGLVSVSGTIGSGGTVTLASARNIDASTGTLVAYQVRGSSGNAASGVTNAAVDLSGTSGAVFNNQIQTLGPLTANTRGPTDGSIGSDLTVANGRALAVTSTVQATAGNVAITLPGTTSTLIVTDTGSVAATNALSGGVPSGGNITIATNAAITIDGLVAGGKASTVSLTPDAAGAGTRATLTVDNTNGHAGLVTVQSFIGTGGAPNVVQPGTIILRSDNLVLNSASAAVSAPDGLVMIAPRATGDSISLDPVNANNGSVLSLGAATLRAINTLGTLSAGLPGAGALLLGSYDGATSNVTGITVTGSIVLSSIRTLALFANGPVTETGAGAIAASAVAGYGTALLFGSGANAISALGVPTQISSGGQTFISALPAPALTNVTATSGTGSIRVHNTSGTLNVVGTLIAGTSQTIDLASPALVIDATRDNGLFNNASLTVGGSTTAPGQILLAADSLRIVSAGSAPIVTATEGLVAITPFTASHAISIDNTASSTASVLSLGTGDLALIQTRAGSDTATAALGSQTLMIGSQDGGASLPNSGITVNAALNLDGGTHVTADTLALYSTGSVTGSGAITVDTLTGRAGVLLNGGLAAPAADILLTGNNAIGTIGAVAAAGSLSSGDLIASGAVSEINAGNLTQRVDTTVQAGDDPGAASPHNNAQLTVRGGTLAVNGTILAGIDGVSTGNVGLYAGSIVNGTTISAAGAVTLASTGSLYASGRGGVLISAAGDIGLGGVIWGGRTTGDLAGSVTLVAAGSINQASDPAAGISGIGSNLLTGSAGGHAALLGDGSPTQNRIVALGAFTTNLNGGADPAGFQLRDGRDLTVTGAVTDGTAGVSIAVAPPNGSGGFASGDIVLAGVITANAVTKLQATGNIYQTAGGAIIGGTLTAQAGIVPDTETASGLQIAGNAAVFLGGANQVATLGDLGATGNVLLVDGRDLAVTGTVRAGTGTVTAAAGSVSGATSGPFGTTPASSPAPFLEIDVIQAGSAASGNLTVAPGGIVQAGVDDPAQGNVTLRAGNNAVAGSVLVNGAVYASGGGTISVSAGFAPNGGYNSVASGSGISINGTLAGDRNGTVPASLVNLDAASSIDEQAATASIDATLLTGHVGGHANLSQAANGAQAQGASGNRIANLGSFVTNAATDDPQGLLRRDGAGLTVLGPVTDSGANASRGVSIAVAPGSGATYMAADLVLNGVVSARTAVNLQATGNVYEQAGGTVVAATLLGQAGLLPDTDAGGALGPTVAAAFFGGINQVGTLGNITATGNILVDNGQSLQVAGTIAGGTLGGSGASLTGATPGLFGTAPGGGQAPFIEIDVLRTGSAVSGALTIGPAAVLHAGADSAVTGSVTLRAGSDSVSGAVTVNGAVYAANGGTVDISTGFNPVTGAYNTVASGSALTLNGAIGGDQSGSGLAGLVNLAAASAIDEAVAGAAIGASVLTGHAGGHANLSEAASGTLPRTASANRIASLGAFAVNTGTQDAQGFQLRNGQALTVAGPVTDTAAAGQGISIAVVPGLGAGYAAADLVIGGTISAPTTVNLQSTGAIIEQGAGAIVTGTLTSQAGVIPSTEVSGNTAGQYPLAVTLGGATDFLGLPVNQIGTLANVTATGAVTLDGASNLTVGGTVLGGVTPQAARASNGMLIGTGVTIAATGTVAVTGTINVGAQSGVLAIDAATVALAGTLSPTLRAATIEVAATSGASIVNGATIATGGDAFKRPFTGSPPVDPGVNAAGAHFLVGAAGFTQSGVLSVLPFNAATAAGSVATTHPALDIRLTTGGGTIAFDQAQGLSASSTSLLVTLGDTGSATGRINADDLVVFYTGTFGAATSLFGTLHTASGAPVSDTAAASQAFIARDGQFVPSNHFQVNACAITAVNCVLISPFSVVPVVNPLKDLPSAFAGGQVDDPDLLVPNVSDRDD